jgi:hypothetical protein
VFDDVVLVSVAGIPPGDAVAGIRPGVGRLEAPTLNRELALEFLSPIAT